MIATLLLFGGGAELPALAVALAWGSVVGSALQFGVQVAPVVRSAPDIRLALDLGSSEVRSVVRNFVPAFVSRGVVQLSSYIDLLLASLLPTGAVTGLTNAQLLYTLPVSLFGMSMAAAELPGDGRRGRHRASRGRFGRDWMRGLRRIAFFVVPSAVAFLALGDVVAGGAFSNRAIPPRRCGLCLGHSGGFGRRSAGHRRSGSLYSSTYYALRDTRTPLRYALVRVRLTTVFGYVCALSAATLAGHRPVVGRGRPDGVGRRRGLGRDAAAAARHERTDRPDRGCRPVTCCRLGEPPRWPVPRSAWALKLALPGPHRDHRCCGPGTVRAHVFRRDVLAGLPEAATLRQSPEGQNRFADLRDRAPERTPGNLSAYDSSS